MSLLYNMSISLGNSKIFSSKSSLKIILSIISCNYVQEHNNFQFCDMFYFIFIKNITWWHHFFFISLFLVGYLMLVILHFVFFLCILSLSPFLIFKLYKVFHQKLLVIARQEESVEIIFIYILSFFAYFATWIWTTFV